ncbi:MAG: DUF3472 domain-containing protein [Candidatus Saccharimonadales bacterium]
MSILQRIKIVKNRTNQKRDNKGRFSSGSGGVRLAQGFSWRRNIPVIIVVALVGGYFVWRSSASTTPYDHSLRSCVTARIATNTLTMDYAMSNPQCALYSNEAFVYRLYQAATGKNPSKSQYLSLLKVHLIYSKSPEKTAQVVAAQITDQEGAVPPGAYVRNASINGLGFVEDKNWIALKTHMLETGKDTQGDILYGYVRQSTSAKFLEQNFKNYMRTFTFSEVDKAVYQASSAAATLKPSCALSVTLSDGVYKAAWASSSLSQTDRSLQVRLQNSARDETYKLSAFGGSQTVKPKPGIKNSYTLNIMRTSEIIASCSTFVTPPAETVSPRGTYTEWNWTSTVPLTTLQHSLVVNEVKTDAPYFWSHQFGFKGGDGGYVGLQSNGSRVDGTVGKTAVFSIFSSGMEASPAKACKIEQEGFDGYETSGTSCRITYDWQPGRKYDLKVALTAKDNTGNWWSGSIKDTVTNQQTLIAKIKTPVKWTAFKDWSVMWTEYFGGLPETCADLAYSSVNFYQPSANGGGIQPSGTKNVLSTGDKCNNSSIAPTNFGSTQKMGTQR